MISHSSVEWSVRNWLHLNVQSDTYVVDLDPKGPRLTNVRQPSSPAGEYRHAGMKDGQDHAGVVLDWV